MSPGATACGFTHTTNGRVWVCVAEPHRPGGPPVLDFWGQHRDRGDIHHFVPKYPWRGLA